MNCGTRGRTRPAAGRRSGLAALVLAVVAFGGLAGSAGAAGTVTVCSSGCDSTTIQGAVALASSGDTITVAAGTYVEDVTVDKTLTLLGAGAGSTTVSGPSGGSGSTFAVAAPNVVVDGFRITREGNAPATWNDPGLNTAGVSIQGSATAEVRNSRLTGNRTGIDINNSNGNSVHNNVIDDNRTGLILRNQTDNTTVAQNRIAGNWTVGVLFLDASGGTNSPVQTALNSAFTNNDLSGNWYGQVVERQSGGALPAPGTNLKNFSGNWWGSTAPVVTTANSAEPGYAAQIPVAYGGTATAPGGQPDIAGPASANIDYTPYLNSGTDTSAASGFQGDFSSQTVTAAGAQTGSASRIQEAVDNATGTGTVNVLAGSYPVSAAVQITKPLKLNGANATINPNDPTTPANPNAARVAESTITATGTGEALRIGSSNVVVNGLRFTDTGTAGGSNATLVGAGGSFGGLAPGISIKNNLFDGISRIAVYFNGPTSMNGGVVKQNRVSSPTRAAGCGTGALASSACGHQLFNLWQTDHLFFQDNVVVASPGNGDRVRVLNVGFPNGPSLQSDSPATNITIAGNTIRNSCTFTCFTLAAGATNVSVTGNDVVIDAGNALQLHPTWTGGRVDVNHNVFTEPNDFAVVVDNPSADLSGLHVNRNSLAGGGFRNAASQAVDGTCNWWGSGSGPVAAQNAGPVTTVPWLTSSNLDGACNGGSARAYKNLALSDLAGLTPSGNKDTDKRIADARSRITASLAAANWIDDDHVVVSHGDSVFTAERDAVQSLLRIKGTRPAGATRAIDDLVRADRVLAQTLIDDRTAAHGNTKKLADARKELAKAEDSIVRGDSAGAVGHFKNAWKLASQA